MSRVLQYAVYVQAHQSNFSQAVRSLESIKFIVVHYTGNVGDTARNNAMYFRESPVVSSAHYFVSENSIYQSVPDNHAAYAVGLGGRSQPYDASVWGWKKITNSNSISVEICGSKTSNEATEEVKQLAAMLVCDLLDKYHLTPDCVYRHYDVTGKWCPWWAVETPMKWDEFKTMVRQIFEGEEDDELKNTEENYSVFKTFMDRYFMELAANTGAEWEQTAMAWAAQKGLINDGRPRSLVTRAELATVTQRMYETGIH